MHPAIKIVLGVQGVRKPRIMPHENDPRVRELKWYREFPSDAKPPVEIRGLPCFKGGSPIDEERDKEGQVVKITTHPEILGYRPYVIVAATGEILVEAAPGLDRMWDTPEEAQAHGTMPLPFKVSDEQMGSAVAGVSDVPQDGGGDAPQPDSPQEENAGSPAE